MKLKNLSKYIKPKYIPNTITIFRIFLTFPLIYFLESKNIIIVWLLLLIGCSSDYFDGFIARKFKFKSRLGTILDPLADKLFTLIPLIWLSNNNLIPFWSISILIIIEFIISAFRETKNNGLPASNAGKLKTIFIFCSLLILFFPFKNLIFIGLFFYWIGFILAIFSLIKYLRVK